MSRRPASLFIALAAAMVLPGCASLDSTPSLEPDEGLVYYMPKKDIVVSVVRTDGKAAVTIEEGAAYPDLSQPYVLNFRRNWLGKNELKVGIGTTGLLTSSKSVTTSQVGEVLKALGGSPQWRTLRLLPEAEKADCPNGSSKYIYPASSAPIASSAMPCGMKIEISRVAASKPSRSSSGSAVAEKNRGWTRASRDFYRQSEGYRVRVSDGPGRNSIAIEHIVLSPSMAPTRFLPIEKTFFANNTADFGFTDGMPTKYDQEADGEVLALVKIPADVAGAYFEAVGKVFTNFKTVSNQETDALAAALKLELAKKQSEACTLAILQKDEEKIEQLGCGK